MFIFKTVAQLQNYLQQQRNQGKTIGFVPTMGALHAGHLSLIQMASQQTNCTVVSIFVNPTQFNEKDDFEKYPRPVERDMELLASHTGCNLLFLPDVAEVYPSGLPPQQPFDLGEVALPMEGKSRPGHFNGVAQVVNRLLNIVQPTALFMGQKDFQQVAVVRRLLALTNSTVRLVACPTLREPNGLAMSSRNERLTPHERQMAGVIYEALQWAAQQFNNPECLPQQVQRYCIEQLNGVEGMHTEYFEIVDAQFLQPLVLWQTQTPTVACVAVRFGAVRLIDNVLIN
ncbi:MAG: pantoate--beta-alanine ligase [Sphingobacteriales bacterium]|jgi:pantoate--beta-alanine ligase|nr:pantoate--beta-alanine ligase [Sphingobacteriales bacterium]MBP9140963.1 pantoate--beta-alanine ligase [Chitinophagales bacterium]MDA0199407.1 pantoate--beta-alanine ligase [Bacteroidota bacterium]MBK6889375.1 pantoate--beta-alanine ligase [Sphingobacteriales bacterium]MBK7528124.1 pantoate--beta-alanine ligase [Sphingobacteriales bacterium]